MGLNWTKITNIGTKLNQKNNTTTNWHVALALTRGTIVTWHTWTNFWNKKIKKIKKKIKKPGADTWHVLFKNVNYLNTVSEKDQIDHNLTKMRT